MSERLHSAARRNGLTLNTIVQGAWGLLLARYSGYSRRRIRHHRLGTPPRATRSRIHHRDVHQHHPHPRPDLRQPGRPDLAARPASPAGQSRQFDFVSLPQLQSWSDLPPGANLFDSIVVFENYPYDENSAAQAGLHIRDIQVRDTTNFPLTLIAYLAASSTSTSTYDPALFDTATAERHRPPTPGPARRHRR